MLIEINAIPEGFLDVRAEDLHELLKNPTLIHLNGVNPQPLFISTLLHGNETTGLYAIQRLLKAYSDKPLPRAISIFIGNIEAAKENQRSLDTQDDYNRIWPGTHHSDSPEKDMMQSVTHIMQKKKPFASIDVHNNTGKNPHYGCINILNPHGLLLAAMFSDVAVYFTSPKGVQSSAFSDFCPAIVLECGQSSDSAGEDHALKYLQSVLELEDLSSGDSGNLKLYHTVARVTIPQTVSLDDVFDNKCTDVCLNHALEDKNFHLICPGTELATVNPAVEKMVLVSSESEEDVTDEYFKVENDKLLFKKAATLAMFTANETAIRQDCVCYLMEELKVG